MYAFDSVRRELTVVWAAARGFRSLLIGRLRPAMSDEQAGRLSAELTGLSQALWETYVRPASSFVDDDERQRREEEREQLDAVASALRKPNLPDPSGLLIVSYSSVEEAAHRLGRVLHQAADEALTEAVAADVGVEVDAVVRAELGDLSGRAEQAASLDRVDASPVQVSAADELLRTRLLGGELLSAAVDPAAACVAAAHWLAAAAVVAADEAGVAPERVFATADDIEAVSVEVPTLVVRKVLTEQVSPRQVVIDLLRKAVAAADGVVDRPDQVIADYDRLKKLVARLPAVQREEVLASEPVRTTLLDPRRPARDLLEHLLNGIASCRLLYAEYAGDDFGDDAEFEDDDEDVSSGSGATVGTEDVESGGVEAFAALVRLEVEETRDRLS
ncbi:hypothetical protein OG400_12425 [Micromonospora ureilytica]|uniref:hypothetical protein n=1 Tax=Micromonospora ureilytica TaxID=709868 RepID=UPI002E12259D|nr:hypothetical protein OG400_12425 [Micromonospora ureilytica]